MMTRQGEARARRQQPPSEKQVDSDLVTAQILAGFQYEGPSRSKPTERTGSCHSQVLDSCLKECELPCTADCTDDCVVVCEEPHHLNEDLCCDLQDACDNRDCQYSYLDESCCYGCDVHAFSLLDGHSGEGLPGDAFDLSALPLYQQHHDFSTQFGVHQQGFRGDGMGSGHLGYRPICYTNVGLSHCAMACPGSSTDDYQSSPIPSLIPSTADSPWSLQSSISGPSIQQYTPLPPSEAENPLSVLASYTATDVNLFAAPESIHSPTNVRVKPQDINHLTSASELGQFAIGPDPSQAPLSGISDTMGFSDLNDFAKTSEDQDSKVEPTTLQCRWIVPGSVGPKLCGCNFDSREDLHKHIIDDHVKSMKKRGMNADTLHPICCWHGCESARKKKVFKLQHLKDHIVCHSKLRMKCEVCGKECRDAKVLKLHMNTHRPGQEKPFRCDFEGCTASFGTSALLSSHKRVHTGEKPHKCAWCDYRAADKGNLRRHEEEMHMGKKWPCPYCSQKLAKKANLTRHIRDLHANEALDAPLDLL